MPATLELFISSKMQELRAERAAVFECVKSLHYGDIQLHAWEFERDAPASGRSIRDVYLSALQNSALYIGIVWNEYGEWTVDELEKATDWGIERHLYVKDVDSHNRDRRLRQLLEKFGPVPAGINPKWFTTTEELKSAVRQSIETWISERLRTRAAGASAVLARDPDDVVERPRKLIGREALLREVGTLLAAGERVLLHGFSGMGKTALAAIAAGEWIQGGKGSVLWLRAGSSSDEILFESLTRPLGVWQQMLQLEGDARALAFRKALRDSEARLVVLDDCWNGRALFAVLTSLPSDMPALITARQRYAVDHMVDVAELTAENALALLSVHAKQELTEAEAGALCRRLAYHPFSLGIAGKALRAQKLRPDELLARIADAPHDMKVPGDFSLKERSSVKDLLDASVSVLDEESRRVFFAFGAFFAPQVTVEMLTHYLYSKVVWGGEEELLMPAIVGDDPRNMQPVRKALESLEIQGLAHRTSTGSRTVLKFVVSGKDIGDPEWKEETELVEHYRIHDLSFSYVRAQTSDEQRKNALDICLAYTFFHIEPGPETYTALRSERDNLLGAATFAISQAHYHHVERLATNLFVVSGFFEAEGAYGDAVRLLEQAAEASKRRGDTSAYYRDLGNLGKACLHLKQTARALDYSSQALRLAQESGDDEVALLMLSNIGAIHLQADDVRQAHEFLIEALEIARKRRDRRREAMLLGNLGVLLARVGRRKDAYNNYKEVLNISRELGDDEAMSKNLVNMASLFFEEQDYGNAALLYRDGIQTLRRLGNRADEAIALHGLGYVYRQSGDTPSAVEAWRTAQDLFVTIGNEQMGSECTRLIAAARAASLPGVGSQGL